MADEITTFHVGDSDLRFLGLAAMVAARFEALRKGGQVNLPTFPQSDHNAVEIFLSGALAGAAIAFDDIPSISVSVTGSGSDVQRLLRLARSLPDDPSDLFEPSEG